YRESLRLASEAGLESFAFPCISTGVYGYPKSDACQEAITAVTGWLSAHELPRSIIFCCYGSDNAGLYRVQLTRFA
ncbi:macro domain-containing protein, partial [Patescibacteria group bacterium]|nr:macro domain-containing protein [Patescibacteria group bacterium]